VDAVGDGAEVVVTWVLVLEGYISEVLDGALEAIAVPLLHPYITRIVRPSPKRKA